MRFAITPTAATDTDWHLYIARGPKCNPQSAQCSSVLQSTSTRTPPSVKCKIAPSVRTWNCAGPGKGRKTGPRSSR
eukprot:12271921-Alexandrium_andersonii.AAC.1